jgi:hypothetical protein
MCTPQYQPRTIGINGAASSTQLLSQPQNPLRSKNMYCEAFGCNVETEQRNLIEILVRPYGN